MIVKLLTEHHLEFLSLRGGCRGSSKSTLVKMPHCLISHATAHYIVHTVCYRDVLKGPADDTQQTSRDYQPKS